jgi:hypothetical protein
LHHFADANIATLLGDDRERGHLPPLCRPG